jgi:DNA processing protein
MRHPCSASPAGDRPDGSQRAARAALAYLFDPGPHVAALVSAAGRPQAAYHQLRRDGGRPDGLRGELSGLATNLLWYIADRITETVATAGGRVVVPADEDWPARLPDLAAATSTSTGEKTSTAEDVPDVPGVLCLFVHGTAPADRLLDRSVAITGSRAATAYGTEVARELGYGCACAGWTVVSGGGYGCEAAAHRAALAAGDGATVAILPGGLDHPHPAGNRPLFEQIVGQGGLLVSVYPPGIPPTRPRVVATRRLLATLSAGTVLVEASRRSSSLPSLRHARVLGRPAMIVPGPVTSATSAGCHQALRDDPRLRLVTSTVEVLAELQPTTAADRTTQSQQA